mmetsp:Transcript_118616/g.206061  ORF Transcript_118616/g.206061 Transcript_118616/m.206061 type:complete len:235 (+) Transcript_118616:1582-2286(+)
MLVPDLIQAFLQLRSHLVLQTGHLPVNAISQLGAKTWLIAHRCTNRVNLPNNLYQPIANADFVILQSCFDRLELRRLEVFQLVHDGLHLLPIISHCSLHTTALLRDIRAHIIHLSSKRTALLLDPIVHLLDSVATHFSLVQQLRAQIFHLSSKSAALLLDSVLDILFLPCSIGACLILKSRSQSVYPTGDCSYEVTEVRYLALMIVAIDMHPGLVARYCFFLYSFKVLFRLTSL